VGFLVTIPGESAPDHHSFSDRGLPKIFPHMNGYGSHTYSFINARNEHFWVKFYFQAPQGIRCMTYEGSAKIIYRDRENLPQELYYAFEKADFPKWQMFDAPVEDPQHKEPPLKFT